jgi:hypothetical protein
MLISAAPYVLAMAGRIRGDYPRALHPAALFDFPR